MRDDDYLYFNASELVDAYVSKTLSPVEVITASLARAETVQAHYNPVTEFFAETALDAARKAEARYSGKDASPRPLEGVPIAIKEEFALCGSIRSSASLLYADRVDKNHTDVYIQRLLDGGAIPLVKTTTPEFCLLGSTWSRRYGVTTNPWNADMTCGGSSGGSGSTRHRDHPHCHRYRYAIGQVQSVFRHLPVVCLATDIGGSPYGRNPEVPVFNLDYYSHSGPMARSTTDIITMQSLTVGQHRSDIASLPKPPPHVIDPNCLKGLRVAMTPTLCGYEIDKDVADNFLAACNYLSDAGAKVEEVDLRWRAVCQR